MKVSSRCLIFFILLFHSTCYLQGPLARSELVLVNPGLQIPKGEAFRPCDALRYSVRGREGLCVPERDREKQRERERQTESLCELGGLLQHVRVAL